MTYYYQVQATNSAGSSAFSNTASAELILPTVSVSALESTIDADPETGYLDFHRTGDAVAPLTANIDWDGTTATAGKDYAGTLPATVTFGAGYEDAVVAIPPADGAPDFATVIDATVAGGAGLTPASGTTQLSDDAHGLSAVLGNGSDNVTSRASTAADRRTGPR